MFQIRVKIYEVIMLIEKKKKRNIQGTVVVTLLTYFSTNEGRSDFGFQPPNRDPFNVLPISSSP